MSAPAVSCVICAYNEGSRIGEVLKVVDGHPQVSEVIVVDDGSHDTTAEVVRSFPEVKLVVQEKNVGKSASLVRGVALASGELIMMLDADLKNLTRDNVTALIEPVISGRADVSISIRGNSLPLYRAIGIDFVSGERVMPRTLITDYTETIQALPSFGVESFLNQRIIEHNLRIAIVPLRNVINTRKAQKIGRIRGTLSEWKMTFDILRVLSPFEVVRQNYKMLQLSRAGARFASKSAADLSHE